ncbi:DUF4303 domain-containing protein [Hymenobacter sp. CRA2]|uniref:DUF4303 domain-containing protein n=1 Tax=Hymenobacter sp. CRA2 TaxID=1955620 RepID=UPI00099018F4|nr:DUF4303 domain-containing protein [Hymenobacter sp. CRA2]OON68880.1 hypothetical protein B0919_11965 [Hymenobacter sp. CRA2]
MPLDFTALAAQITQATQAAFLEMLSQHRAEGIYAFALYSDEGAMTVCPATNTLVHLAQQPADEAAYYKFEPAEWKYEMMGADEQFNAICYQLRAALDELPEDDDAAFEAFREQLYATCVQVLDDLHRARFFQQAAGREVFLMFSVSEDDPDPAATARMISQLNDNAYRDEYLAWLRTWAVE